MDNPEDHLIMRWLRALEQNAPNGSAKADLGVLCFFASGDERYQFIRARLSLTNTSVSGVVIHTQLQLPIESSRVGKVSHGQGVA